MHEAADGDWVERDEAEREIAKLLAVMENLPKCENHPSVTAKGFCLRYGAEHYFCDLCSGPPGTDLPHAEALRALEKP
jgi:hypothetical protein